MLTNGKSRVFATHVGWHTTATIVIYPNRTYYTPSFRIHPAAGHSSPIRFRHKSIMLPQLPIFTHLQRVLLMFAKQVPSLNFTSPLKLVIINKLNDSVDSSIA